MEALGFLGIVGALISFFLAVVFLVMSNNVSLIRNRVVRDGLTPVDEFRKQWAFATDKEATKQALIDAIYYEWRLVAKKPEGQAGKRVVKKLKSKYASYMQELGLTWPELLD